MYLISNQITNTYLPGSDFLVVWKTIFEPHGDGGLTSGGCEMVQVRAISDLAYIRRGIIEA